MKAAEPVTAGGPPPAEAAHAAEAAAPEPARAAGEPPAAPEPSAEPEPPAVPEPTRAPRHGRRRALATALLSWAVPGLGHLVLGLWLRGLAFGLLVGATAAVGVSLSGRLYWFGYGVSAGPFDPTSSPESPALVAAASLVSIGLGLPTAALRWLAGYQGDVTAPGYEIGTAFLLTAGLMNLLLVFDAWDEARWGGPPR